ncbi:Enoyl-CoA hydratase/carnithine racemase [Pseudonocardia thermophila]|uniref:Enoyl-CoA hydratase/carnithine racemase n=1 Tax=Pseudonocardia thermophila TaxID=1848 RepID=A0A1M6WQX3_PSETH|nr:enoyl-CoA hydratase-related protein [Pseudonocardia thermophila]SHK96133.1 Enoyl-CoA hydratase/carnithine racemase [Pseudonocardia thermophila]
MTHTADQADTRAPAPAVRWEELGDGLVRLVLDDPTAKVNTLNDAFARAMDAALDRLEAQASELIGVILTSAKSSFFAGGDLNRLLAVRPEDRAAFVADVDVRKRRLHRLENAGVPVVAVLDGAALGGGLELALACHRRIAVRSPRTVVGFPETVLGLIPGVGGVVRSTLLLGSPAIDLITSGRRLDADAAHAAGLVDDVTDSVEQALERASAWLRSAPRPARQRWDTAPARIRLDNPHPEPRRAARAGRLVARVVALAATGDVAAAMHAESEALGELVVTPEAKNTIRVNFHDLTSFRRAATQRAAATEPMTVTFTGGTEAARRLLACAKAWRYTEYPEGGPAAVTGGIAGRGGRVTVEITDAEELAPGQARLHEDVVGDGLHFLEVAIDPADPAREAIAGSLAALIRHGLGVVEVSPGPAPSAVLAARAAETAAGYDPAVVAEAVAWAGLRCVASAPAQDVTDTGIAAAGHILRAVATAAVELADEHAGLRDAIDLATVRLGLMPPWTGGARRYLTTPTTEEDTNA